MPKKAKPQMGCRVLMLLENNPYPGDLRVRREALSLVKAGHQVTVISPGKKHHRRQEVVDGVRVYRFPAPAAGDGLFGYLWEYGFSLFASSLLTIWVFCRHGFDVIHAHNPPDLFVLIALVFRVFGKQFVFDHHDLSPEMYAARFRKSGRGFVASALIFFEWLSCRVADHVIATNESYRRIEMERAQVSPDRVTIVRNGPDLNRIKRVAADEELRARASTILGYVGIMGQQDGVDYLLRALQHLRRDLNRHDFFAIIVGRGDALEDLKQQVPKLDLEDHVEFTGRLPDEAMLRCLSTADICVDPDPFNEFNNHSTMIKMMDYMALAKPIVAFDLLEHRTTAQDAALYAKQNDELDFARQIVRLMDSPELRNSMGRTGRRRIEEELAWHHQEVNLCRVYERLGYRSPMQQDNEATVLAESDGRREVASNPFDGHRVEEVG